MELIKICILILIFFLLKHNYLFFYLIKTMFCKNVLNFVLSNLQRTIPYTAQVINYIFLTFIFDEFFN